MESIFNYTDYRKYIVDFFEERKRLKKHFSLRMLAERSGFKARDYLMRVMRGDRNLSLDGAGKLSGFFRFSKKESEYFHILVQFNQAEMTSEKERCYHRLSEIRKYGAPQKLRRDQFGYLTTWYHSALRSLLPVLGPNALPSGPEDWEKVAKLLDPPITAKQARDSADLLMRLGLLEKDSKGKYAMAETALATNDEVASLGVAAFHRATMELAKRSIDRHPPTARDISGITMNISQDGFRRIKSEIRAFRKRIQAIASGDAGEDMVYRLNLHLYPLTRHQGAP